MGQLLGQLPEMLLCELRHSSCLVGLFQSSFVSVCLFYKTINVFFFFICCGFLQSVDGHMSSGLMDKCLQALLGSKLNFISTDQEFVT